MKWVTPRRRNDRVDDPGTENPNRVTRHDPGVSIVASSIRPIRWKKIWNGIGCDVEEPSRDGDAVIVFQPATASNNLADRSLR
jgi:hypothetical protein